MINALRNAVKELGPVNGLAYAIDRALVRLGTGARLHRYYFVAQPIPKAQSPHVRPRSKLDIRELKPGDPAFSVMPLTPEVLEFRFAQQAMCLGAFKGEALVGYLWLCFAPYREDEVQAVFEPQPSDKTVWDFDMYVFPEHRLGRAFIRIWEGANALLRERGIVWTVSRIGSYNRMSIASHARLGARVLGSAFFLRRNSAQLMIGTIPPYVHVSLFGRSRPRLRLYTA